MLTFLSLGMFAFFFGRTCVMGLGRVKRIRLDIDLPGSLSDLVLRAAFDLFIEFGLSN